MSDWEKVAMTYPGSKVKLVDYDAPEEPEDELVTALGEPYKYLRYKGVKTAFYSIGSLARALNREPVTIRKWEAAGVIPQPDFAAGKIRLYTAQQIAGLRSIAEDEGILRETWHAVHTTRFSERARTLFKSAEGE